MEEQSNHYERQSENNSSQLWAADPSCTFGNLTKRQTGNDGGCGIRGGVRTVTGPAWSPPAGSI